jgi:hypothetical protein
MIRFMYDSNVLDDIPVPGSQLAAAYGTGRYAVNQGEFIARFPDIPRILIDVTGEGASFCSVLDVENDAASPADAARWIGEHHKAQPHGWATVYSSVSTLPEIYEATGSLISGKDYWHWLANPDLDQSEAEALAGRTPGCIGVQFLWPGYGSAGHWDMSVITADWWHPQATADWLHPQVPLPAPAPKPVAVPGVRYGVVYTTDPDWKNAVHPQVYRVTSSDGGKTWDNS